MHLPLSCLIFPTCIGKPGAIFSAHVNIRQTSSVPVVMPGFRQTVFALRRSWHSTVPPAPLISCHWVMRGGRQGTSVCRFKSVPICGPISACAARWSPTKKQNIRVVIEFVSQLLAMLSGEVYLRLKPYLVVKIACDVLTEHCCQVCVLAMMFCRSDCRLCAGMCGKWLRNQETSVPRVLACWHSDRPTWDMKNILYILFSHFTLTETHRC